ncbi:hypothetical protein [Agromyces sp. SYSU T00194]
MHSWYNFAPSEGSWEDQHDRRVLCIAFDPEGLTTGTLAGVGEDPATAN